MDEYNSDLGNLLMRYHNLLVRYYHQNHRSRGPFMDTMRGQGRILSILKIKPEITQKELSYLLDMRVQSLSELLSKLEGKGYITRTPSEEDRRIMVIRLTEKGVAAAEEAEAPDLDVAFQCLSEEEQENLRSYIKRLIATMEEHLGETADGRRGFDHLQDMWENDPRMQRPGFDGGPPPPPPHPHSHAHPGREAHDRMFSGRGGWGQRPDNSDQNWEDDE